ncbi:CopG family transcriptional regulator [Haloplanus halophilus]|uniref:CopG family transcriptional regulator n=1 Tax=Haloplanus halophilus TaxID=2949993 RepID=UPI00203E9AF5|nr:CopG family transcriptional regulator [Haloplanus sp. GDY1]
MAGEQSEAFPDELRDWIERKAAERDASPETVLARAVMVYRALDAETADDAFDFDPDQVAELDDRVGAVEDDLDAKIEDVRERVIQVKREADAKAPADHDHPELADRVEAARRAAEDVDDRIDDLDDRLDSGFENYEEILEYLTETTDDLDRQVDQLAGAVVDVRSELGRVAAAEHDREAVDDLRTAANRHGERTAACGDCGATVDLGLLSRPQCPHCEATYVDFEPATGFFGSATLTTGDRPALTDGTDATDLPGGAADLLDAETRVDGGEEGTDDG